MTNLAEVLFEIEKNNIRLSLTQSVTGEKATIKVEGLRDDVERCTPIIKAHKAEIVRHLTGATESAQSLPSWCRAGCSSLDVIPGAGAGCVQSLGDGQWLEEWRRLDTMMTCPTQTYINHQGDHVADRKIREIKHERILCAATIR